MPLEKQKKAEQLDSESSRSATESKPSAFGEVVEEYSGFVYNVALRMTGNPHDAEDIMQEVFLSAYRAYPSFRGESSLSTWLYRIAINASLMKVRKEKRSRYLTESGVEEMEIPSRSAGPEAAALNAELRAHLQEGLSLLPADLRAAVVLRDVQELSGPEAAETLGISLANLKTRVHRGRVLLRKFLSNYIRKTK